MVPDKLFVMRPCFPTIPLVALDSVLLGEVMTRRPRARSKSSKFEYSDEQCHLFIISTSLEGATHQAYHECMCTCVAQSCPANTTR